jgi:hypothetical protein
MLFEHFCFYLEHQHQLSILPLSVSASPSSHIGMMTRNMPALPAPSGNLPGLPSSQSSSLPATTRRREPKRQRRVATSGKRKAVNQGGADQIDESFSNANVRHEEATSQQPLSAATNQLLQASASEREDGSQASQGNNTMDSVIGWDFDDFDL